MGTCVCSEKEYMLIFYVAEYLINYDFFFINKSRSLKTCVKIDLHFWPLI